MNVIDEICKKHGLSKDQLRGERRDRKFVLAREECAQILRKQGLSYHAIGKIMNKDHTAIMHYLRVTKKSKEVKRVREK